MRSKTKSISTKRSPWAWIPTLYFAQGLPYVAVMTISVIMYKRLGMSNTDIALYTGWLGLPWVIKPFWSPFVDLIKSKRWWTLSMQWIVAFSLAGIAFTIPTALYVQFTLAIFMLMGFASATHDIAADGFYMIALTEHEQSFYVGIRSTFYRVATVVGQGLLVILAGLIEMNTGLEPLEMQLVVDPDAQVSTAVLPGSPSIETSNPQELQFACNWDALYGVAMPEVAIVEGDTVTMAQMLEKANEYNRAGGYPEIPVGQAAAVTQEKNWSKFRLWIERTFGEERTASKTAESNIAVAAVRLNQPIEGDDQRILIVNFKDGDQSVRLARDTRLVFNSDNWDKPAYVGFVIDPKIKQKTQATFVGTSGNIPMAWSVVFIVLSIFFFAVVIYHSWALPRPQGDSMRGEATAKGIVMGFVEAFRTFFTKFPVLQTVAAILFMLLYRFPEAQLTKIIQPFLLDPVDKGGLGLTTGEVGIVYGTVGIIGLTIGGIIGGMVAAKGGLKKWLMPMAWSMSLTCLTFIYLSYAQDHSLLTVNICVFIEQFGYGFGYTAYMLYLIYYSEGQFKTSHYAICTGFMALSMMTGMIAGWIQETVGYRHFFVWTIICCVATIGVSMIIKVDPSFGKKLKNEK